MKRVLAILIVVCLILSFTFLLGGCGKKGECDECGKVATLKTFKFEGEKYDLCKDCYNLMKALTSFSGLFG